MPRLTLILNSELGDVPFAAVAIHRICIHLGMSEVHAGEVELCAVEAITNAICHAYHGQQGHTVSIGIEAEANYLLLEISDSGTTMPPEQVDRLIHGSEIPEACAMHRDALPETGRGLPIMHALMDKIEYRSEVDSNLLVMAKYIQVRDTD